MTKKLTTFDIKNININMDMDNTKKTKATQVLPNLGYPEIDSVPGFNSAKAKVKSFISGTIGKMDT